LDDIDGTWLAILGEQCVGSPLESLGIIPALMAAAADERRE